MSIIDDAREAAHRAGERVSHATHRVADSVSTTGRRLMDMAPNVDSVIDDVEVCTL